MTGKLLSHPQALANIMRRIAHEAGELILDRFDEGTAFSTPETKDDGSPVTEADRAAETFITRALADAVPGVRMVGEEDVSSNGFPDLSGEEFFWLVDPLDGTREFIKGGPDFTVNIALIKQGAPILGVIYAPAHGEMYATDGDGSAMRWLSETGTEKRVQCRRPPRGGLTVTTSRSRALAETDRFLEEMKVEKIIRRSSSIKLCMVASGKADLYPCLSETCLWDTAAGQAILEAAGGETVTLGGENLRYANRGSPENPHFLAQSKYLSADAEQNV